MPSKPPTHGSFAAFSEADGAFTWDTPTQRYIEVTELGRGGMGVVHAVSDRLLGREVARKRPNQNGPTTIGQLLREAAITTRLQHPSIPPIFDVGNDEQGPYYTMPVLEGRPLDELEDHDPGTVIALLRQAASAVGHAHERGFVHRDIKPSNLLVDVDGTVWVLDWGVAWDARAPDTTRVGTQGFAAPEQERGACSPASDVHALGKTLLEMLPHADPVLQSIARKATHPDVSARYADGNELAAEFSRWMDGRPVQAHAYPPLDIASSVFRRYPLPIAGAVLTAVVLGSLGWFVLRSEQQAELAVREAFVTSAADQAHLFGDRGLHAEATLFTSAGLAVGDTPSLRGSSVRWSAATRPVKAVAVRPPCEDAVLMHDGWYCRSTRAVHDAAGTQRWDHATPDVRSTQIVGFPDAVLGAAPPAVLTATGIDTSPVDGPVVLGTGSVASRRADAHIQRFEAGSTPSAVFPACGSRTESLWSNATHTVEVCADGRVRSWTADGTSEVRVEDANLAVFTEELLVSTWDRKLVFPANPRGEVQLDDVPAALVPLGNRQLAVRSEQGRTRILDLSSRRWVAELPLGASRIDIADSKIRWSNTNQTIDYELPDDPRPWAWDLTDDGGIDTLLAQDGVVYAGNATGSVFAWHLETGKVETVVEGGTNTVKSLAFHKEHLLASNGETIDTKTGERVSSYVPRLITLGDQAIACSYSSMLTWIGQSKQVALDGPCRELTAFDGRGWVLTGNGEVSHFGTAGVLETVLDVPGSRQLTVDPGGIIVSNANWIRRFTHDGELLWKQNAHVKISTLRSNGHVLAVGDLRGGIQVRQVDDGRLLARWKPHRRRVSSFLFVDDALFSASWDGHAFRYLWPAISGSPSDYPDATATWGVRIEDIPD